VIRTHRAALAFAACLASGSAVAEVALANAWLRPATAGADDVQVYVDIRSTEALELVGARSPAARDAELVLVDPPDPDPTARRVVEKIAVAAERETRLAYLGSHIRLKGVLRDLPPGTRIPLELTFADANGRRRTVTTEALVRGVVLRRPGDAREPAPPPGGDLPGPGAAPTMR
jgi:hypothetical protein